MLNNITNFLNLIAGKAVKSTLDPDDLIPVASKDFRYKGNYRPTAIPFKELQKQLGTGGGGTGGNAGPVCDITMEQKAITFGPEVTVTLDFLTQIPTPDVLIPGVLEVLPESFMNIWVNVANGGYTQLDTWNTQYTGGPWGYSDLSDIETRNYTPWSIYSSSNEETVLYDPISNTYWKFYFVSYDFRSGFTYTRSQIFLPDFCEITFSDGSKMNSASGLVTGPNVTENIDANGITTYTVGGSAMSYSNVLFVDPIFGNDSTGLAGRFDLPYRNIAQAVTIAAGMGGSLTQRTLIYIRKGTYTTSVNLTNWVDFYCEPGVVFNGSGSVRDNGVSVTSNFYGYAKFVAKTSITLNITGNSTVNFQFDYIDNSSAQCINVTPLVGGQSEVLIEGNKIFGTTLGVGYAIALRRKANVTMNIKSWIWAYHSVFDIRDNYDGVLTVNCPKIRLANDNIYGGNFKQAVICYSSTANARMTFNADFVNEGLSYLGGISGMITNWSSSSGIIEVNGNIYGGETYAVYASGNTTSGRVVVTGNMFSNIQVIWASSFNSCYVRKGLISKPSIIGGSTIAMNQNAKVFFDDVKIYNAQVNGDLINIVSATNEVNLYNVIGQSEGALGLAITSAVLVNVKVHASRFNKPLNVNITDVLTPSGVIVDSLVVVPKF